MVAEAPPDRKRRMASEHELSRLRVCLGQHSDRGRKDSNQDFHGACVPSEPLLGTKGIVVALADGISTSNVSRAASEASVRALLEDYYCTSAAWSVRKSAQRVLMAVNSWLYSQTRQSQFRYDQDRGYVCTLSALVLKGVTAHLFHVGDARIYRLRGTELEQLTEDHRLRVSQDHVYLSRALGIHDQIEIDYLAVGMQTGDTFVLATDGVHEYVSQRGFIDTIAGHPGDLDEAARELASEALQRGSSDNLTVQIVRIEDLPQPQVQEIPQRISDLALPPELQPRMQFDGFRILREIHASSRSHLHLALDGDDPVPVVIKTPSVDLRGDPAYLERLMMEDWIAHRISSAHVMKARACERRRNYLYTVSEFIDGQTLAQWMIDNPRPQLEAVRCIVEQIAKGLLAFHRLEMLHQDLRPANIMIDRTGTVKIVDFGSVSVAGIAETERIREAHWPGTAQYMAPEYFLGEPAGPRSDLFSLGVIAYQMLSGQLPYGADVAKSRTRAAQRRLKYRSVLAADREIPAWIDEVLRKATHPDPARRYEDVAEFAHELRHPDPVYLRRTRPPLLERNPVGFWRATALILAAMVLVLLVK